MIFPLIFPLVGGADVWFVRQEEMVFFRSRVMRLKVVAQGDILHG